MTSSSMSASRTVAHTVDGETTISSSTMQASSGGGIQTTFDHTSTSGKNLAIADSGEHIISEQQISRTLNQSVMEKSGSLAVAGGRPFFTKPLVGRSVLRKSSIFPRDFFL